MPFIQNKVIWITGASSGLGLEMARQLDGNGNKLVLSARRTDVLEQIQKELKHPENVLITRIDLEQSAGFQTAAEEVIRQFGRIDIMIHNAGISQRSMVMDTDISVDRRLMEINYFGTIALTKAILPYMMNRGTGHFVVITSLTGKFGFGLRSAYAASKHALHGFFESLYIELGDKGIGVTLVCPGPVQTSISVNALDGSGTATGQMDEMQAKGMPVEKAVSAILKAVVSGRQEVIIGSFKEKMAVNIKSFLPALFIKMARKQNPKGAVK
jgi:dehydrogenase/reductase SDR family member 7B